MTNELKQLGEKWEWSGKELEFAGFGAPLHIINGMSAGIYRPNISDKCCTKARVKQNIYAQHDLQLRESFDNSGMTEEEVEDLLGWAPRIAENTSLLGSGEIPIVCFTDEIKKKVENKLSETAMKLVNRLTDRMKCLPILEAAVEAFVGDFSWVEFKFEDEAKYRLQGVFKELSGYQKESFDFMGYLVYLRIVKRITSLNPLKKTSEN